MQRSLIRRGNWIGTAAVLVFAGVLLATPSTARAEKHKDERLGFSLTYPKKWKKMPVSPDARWLVAEFQSPRPYESVNPKTGGWGGYHTPKIQVVIIPKSAAESRGATVKETDDGVEVENETAYRDLKEYLDAALRRQRGGFHFSDESETEIDGRKVIKYEVTFDKLVEVPRRVIAWAYDYDDAIYGVIGDTLVPHEKKLRPKLEKAFKSLKLFTRTGTLPGDATTGEDIAIDEGPDDDLTEEELKERRDRKFLRQLDRITSTMEDDWDVKEMKHFTLISHADKKYTKTVGEHCEALQAWLGKTFGYVGSGYVGPVIIRICADRDEHSAYITSRNWRTDSYEVVTYKDRDGWSDWAMESLNRGVFDIWLRDKNQSFRFGAPRWISWGLSNFVEQVRTKRRKIEFRADTWDSVRMKKLRRDDGLLTPMSFFTMTSEDLWSNFENYQQAEFFLNFLVLGPGSKGAYKTVFSDYIKNLIVYLDEAEDDEALTELLGTEAKTEEEETDLFRKRSEFFANREAEMLQTLLERTFPGWTDRNWNKMNSSYVKSLK